MAMRILVVSFLFLLGMMSSAAAVVIITPSTQVQWSGSAPNNPNAGDISTIVGTSALVELYKQDVGAASDTGPFAGSYQTTFWNTATDPEDALILHVGGQPSISGTPLYLLVKDGNHDPIWYIFSLLQLTNIPANPSPHQWNGTDTIILDGFWPNAGAISHVSILGNASSVPEPASLLLLASGLVGLGGMAWRRRNT